MGLSRLTFPRWPTLLLAASLALTTIGVAEASRSVRSQRAVAEHALRDYAGFAAWTYQQHLRQVVGVSVEEVLGSVNHGHERHTAPEIPDATHLPGYLTGDKRCGCFRTRHGPPPTAFFGFALGSDSLRVVLNSHANPSEGWKVAAPLPAALRALEEARYPASQRTAINDTISRQIRSRADVGRFPVIVTAHDSTPRFLAYTIMPTSRGDTIVYGAEYERAVFLELLSHAMTSRELLPTAFTRGQPVRTLVQLEVTDATGRLLFASEPVTQWALEDSASIGPAYGALRVKAQIRPTMASSLVIGGLPRSRLPFLLGLLALAAALSFVAVGQIRREGELSRLRADFVASISHELRTPLAQMRLYLDTLRLGRFTTDAQREWSLDNVERETTRLTQLVERVLRFSRAGRADADARQPVDVAEEVEHIVQEFQPLAAARGATVVAVLDGRPRVALQADAMRHLVLNLLDNAVKYGPTGQTVRLHLGVAGDTVQLSVDDEGPGIAPAERDAVWRPYQRGGTAGHTAGSGIGLSIVRDVAQQHGGRAWIADAPGGMGARVVVELPLLGMEAVDAIDLRDEQHALPAPVRG